MKCIASNFLYCLFSCLKNCILAFLALVILSFHVSGGHSHIPFLCLGGLGSCPVESRIKNTFCGYLAFSSWEFYHSGLQTPDVISFSVHQQCLLWYLSPSSSCSLSCCIPRAPSTIGVCKNKEIRTIGPHTIELHQYNRFARGAFLIITFHPGTYLTFS